MAARELRYAWFDELATTHGFTKIAVAHNANDEAETFFVNLIRSTGISGLTGIAPQQGKIVRPLLFATRAQILEYARANDIPFREDSSNASVKYVRNAVRHLVLPQLHNISPAFLATMQHNMERLAQAAAVCADSVADVKARAVSQCGQEIRVDTDKIPVQHILFYLYEILAEYGFAGTQTAKIVGAVKTTSGKHFYSLTHHLLCDRASLILRPCAYDADDRTFAIDCDNIAVSPTHITLSENETLACSIIPISEVSFAQGESCTFLDYEKLCFPLSVRRPRKGDAFVPLGMRGRRKLSDFFIDNKLSVYEKRVQWLVCSNSNIVWIVGRRLDDRYKITNATKKVLRIKYEKII
jgi:tRNA(Ile)-lysidine synthase